MCVILVKERGIDLPGEDVLKECFETNSDGGGFAWVRGGGVHIAKGFMEWDEFLKQWKRREFTKDDLVIAHFRIGTSGKKGPEMCHPFPVTHNEEMLKNPNVTCDLALAHNGVFGRGKGDLSDTALFVKDVVEPVRNHIFEDRFYPLVERAVDGSRVVFIDKNENVLRLGDWEEEEGIFFSNKRWKPIEKVAYNNKTYYGGVYGDDGYENWWEHNGGKATKLPANRPVKKSRTCLSSEKDIESFDAVPEDVADFLMQRGIILTNSGKSKTLYRWNHEENRREFMTENGEQKWSTSNVSQLAWYFPKQVVRFIEESLKEVNDLIDFRVMGDDEELKENEFYFDCPCCEKSIIVEVPSKEEEEDGSEEPTLQLEED
jgi:hypothetical protein